MKSDLNTEIQKIAETSPQGASRVTMRKRRRLMEHEDDLVRRQQLVEHEEIGQLQQAIVTPTRALSNEFSDRSAEPRSRVRVAHK